MSQFNFSEDLFLEKQELDRFQKFLQDEGFKKHILNNSSSFGLINNRERDQEFDNGRVVKEGVNAISINFVNAIDAVGNFITQSEKKTLIVPNTGAWFWIRAKYKATTLEKGTVSISADGRVTGVGTKFTEVLRGLPNFPSRISFSNSIHNTEEYDVLQVIDDNNIIIMKDNTSSTAISTFQVESNLQYAVVGTFTPDSQPTFEQKYPFRYDSCNVELIGEVVENTRPNFIEGIDFDLARVRVQDNNLIIQDKRNESIWKSSIYQEMQISQFTNDYKLVGVECVRFQNSISISETNQIQFAWGMRSNNWTIDTANNTVSMWGSSMGGTYKDTSHFVDGDFDGWRLYTAQGEVYMKIKRSYKQGDAINLELDVLNPDSFPLRDELNQSQFIIAVPDAEEIEFQVEADERYIRYLAAGYGENRITGMSISGIKPENCSYSVTFPINKLFGRIDVLAYKDPDCLYNVKYRLKNHNIYSSLNLLPVDNIGYYVEKSFDGNGILKIEEERERYPYFPNQAGYIKVELSPNAFSKIWTLVYKGDLIGVETISNITNVQVMDLKVGKSKNYQKFVGNITLASDLIISLDSTDAKEGNQFVIQFNCTNLALNGKSIKIVRNNNSNATVLKEIGETDIATMMNKDGGIAFTVTFSDNEQWDTIHQNYDKDPGGIFMSDGDISSLFDSNGRGKVKGWFGCMLCDGKNGTPDLRGRFIKGWSATESVGTRGGSNEVTMTVSNLPEHDHKIGGNRSDRNTSGGGYAVNQVFLDGYNPSGSAQSTTSKAGSANPTPIKTQPSYHALFYYKRN